MDILIQDPKFVDAIPEEFICLMCLKVLNDAQCSTCGCQYCRKCLESHIEAGNDFCPGKNRNCSSKKLDMTSIVPNHVTNRKIENLRIECVRGGCIFVSTLCEMEEHVRTCEWNVVSCVYTEMGCSVEGLIAGETKKHLVDAALQHAALLATWAGQLRNNLEEGRRQSEAQIQLMKDHIETLQKKIEEMEKQQKKSEEDLKKQMETLQKKIEEMEKQQKKSEEDLKKQMETLQKKIEEMEKQQKKSEEDLKKQMEKIEEMEKNKIECLDHKQKIENEAQTFKKEFAELKETLNPGEMIWKIDSMTQKRQDAQNGGVPFIDSAPFYSHRNGYKLHLQMCPDGFGSAERDHVSLFLYIVQGPNDDILSWPCKKRFTLQLLNIDTGQSHTTLPALEFSADNGKKPTTEMNGGYSKPQLISWAVLNGSASLMRNGAIIVKCLCN